LDESRAAFAEIVNGALAAGPVDVNANLKRYRVLLTKHAEWDKQDDLQVVLVIQELAEPRPAPEKSPSPIRKTILFVETDDVFRVNYSSRLRLDGYEVIDASSADGAEALAAEYPREIHLLLAEVRVPDGSGLELREKLKASPNRPHLQNLRVLVQSQKVVGSQSRVSFLPRNLELNQLPDEVRKAIESEV
jgi:CheY-like chemotaxis protein